MKFQELALPQEFLAFLDERVTRSCTRPRRRR